MEAWGREEAALLYPSEGRQAILHGRLYNRWTSPEGSQVCTSTIITTNANEALAPIHDRMPVIMPPDLVDLWLDPGVHEKEKLLPILNPYPDKELELYEVSSCVNSPKNDSAENIERPHN